MSAADNLHPQQFFHGTVRPNLTEITPADKHPSWMTPTFTSDTDRGHAYATTSQEHAWDYASKAHDWALSRSHTGRAGIPRVYQVEPLGEHEPDPQHDEHGRSRGNNSTDRRSRAGWRVVRELPMPEHIGTPEDWR